MNRIAEPFRWAVAALLAVASVAAFPPVPAPALAQEAPVQEAPAAEAPAAAACPAPDALTAGKPLHKAAVRYLADEALEGRLAGSDGERCAGDYIAEEFRRLGLRSGGEDGWFQDVPLASLLNPHAPEGSGRNVIGVLPGSDPALAAEAIVVGAHYDHLGRGGFGSLDPGSGEVHAGADDNASGVAALLAAAERLIRKEPARTVVFVAFTAEELGLLGSARYVERPTVPLDRTVAMLNLDMVGRLEEDPLVVYGVGTAEEWEAILARANEGLDLPLSPQPPGYGPSDHTSFYARDVPVLHFFTNVHPDYHRPSDRWDRVDFVGLDRVSELVARVAAAVADRREPLAVIPGVGAPRRDAGEGRAAWLGSVPDFAYAEEEGVRISGVGPGSPADEAGLQGGDVIVGLGDHSVGDLHDLTAALQVHAPGDSVRVIVRRNGVERAFQAVLGSRSERTP